jgi:hypothetical protein
MATLKQEIIKDLITIENDLGTPTFVWNSNSYHLIPSISDFTRELDTGGFRYDKMLTATVRKWNVDGTATFSGSVYPKPQQKITYADGNDGGTSYRIESTKHSPEGAYFRIIAISTTNGL